MGNTVRRPRRRPREDSCAWKSFGWLLRRTVAFAMIEGNVAEVRHPAWRRYLAESSSTAVERFYERRVRRWPALAHSREFLG